MRSRATAAYATVANYVIAANFATTAVFVVENSEEQRAFCCSLAHRSERGRGLLRHTRSRSLLILGKNSEKQRGRCLVEAGRNREREVNACNFSVETGAPAGRRHTDAPA